MTVKWPTAVCEIRGLGDRLHSSFHAATAAATSLLSRLSCRNLDIKCVDVVTGRREIDHNRAFIKSNSQHASTRRWLGVGESAGPARVVRMARKSKRKRVGMDLPDWNSSIHPPKPTASWDIGMVPRSNSRHLGLRCTWRSVYPRQLGYLRSLTPYIWTYILAAEYFYHIYRPKDLGHKNLYLLNWECRM